MTSIALKSVPGIDPQAPAIARSPVGATPRAATEAVFTTHDGVELFYRHWPALRGPARGAVLLFHRGHEHSGRIAHLVDELGMDDFAFFA